MERTHRWLDRCVAWRAERGPEGQRLFGIVQGGVHEDLRRESAERIGAAAVDGIAIGGSLGQDKAEMREVVRWAISGLPDGAPRHLLGVGDVDDILHAVSLGVDMFDCATPTRLGRHGTALVPDPEARWRLDLTKPSQRESGEPIASGCPCPACRGHTRAYLHYLARAKELTGARLVTLHNLTFMALLMRQIQQAVAEDRLGELERQVSLGQAPYIA
jgi:queuine tRNA-ribosyltransferase